MLIFIRQCKKLSHLGTIYLLIVDFLDFLRFGSNDYVSEFHLKTPFQEALLGFLLFCLVFSLSLLLILSTFLCSLCLVFLFLSMFVLHYNFGCLLVRVHAPLKTRSWRKGPVVTLVDGRFRELAGSLAQPLWKAVPISFHLARPIG